MMSPWNRNFTPEAFVTSVKSEPATFFRRESSPPRIRLHATTPPAAARTTARASNRRTKSSIGRADPHGRFSGPR